MPSMPGAWTEFTGWGPGRRSEPAGASSGRASRWRGGEGARSGRRGLTARVMLFTARKYPTREDHGSTVVRRPTSSSDVRRQRLRVLALWREDARVGHIEDPVVIRTILTTLGSRPKCRCLGLRPAPWSAGPESRPAVSRFPALTLGVRPPVSPPWLRGGPRDSCGRCAAGHPDDSPSTLTTPLTRGHTRPRSGKTAGSGFHFRRFGSPLPPRLAGAWR